MTSDRVRYIFDFYEGPGRLLGEHLLKTSHPNWWPSEQRAYPYPVEVKYVTVEPWDGIGQTIKFYITWED